MIPTNLRVLWGCCCPRCLFDARPTLTGRALFLTVLSTPLRVGLRYSEGAMRSLAQTIFVVAFVLVPSFGLAQEASPTPAPFPRIQSTELRQTSQRLHQRMMDVNRTRLAGYERILERLRSMLERITAIADRYEARGADASEVYKAEANARKAIDAAQSAVREQASREYLLEGATDLSVREELQGMREQLADDLGRIRPLMKAAVEAVRDAIRALRSVHTS